ncbi:MAG TPA: hypothetical protein DIC60_02940 [Lachnospiraceae bacterium]|nr:hypothetical protein [Lachnospiraceae bacterium]
MSITYFPFDAVKQTDGSYDRAYTSEQFAMYFSKLFSNGVFGADSNGLQVTALNGNMYISVAAGSFFINGRFYCNDETENILITTGNISYGRYDRVVARADYVNRMCGVYVVEGTPSSNPTVPKLTQNADTHEIPLATIYVAAGATSLTLYNITDERVGVYCTLTGFTASDYFTAYSTAFQQYQNQVQNQTDTQLANQQTEFNHLKNSINEWYQGVLNDISELQIFDFDNIAYRIGATVTTNITDTVITENIIMHSAKIAERTTNVGDTIITCVTKAWSSNGSSLILNSTTTTTITDSTITSTIAQN